MRLGQFKEPAMEQFWTGVVTPNDTVINLAMVGKAMGVSLPKKTVDMLGEWKWHHKARLIVEFAEENGVGFYDEADLERGPPVTSPQKIIAVGLNYTDHAEEGGNPIPDEPVLFSKLPTTIIGPGNAISWNPDFASDIDYEAELVAVIGRKAREIDPEDAWDHIAGYTIGNDVSARDIQHNDDQWMRGKNLDTFAPIGPEIVTPDDIDDPHDLDIWVEVNGERFQHSSTSNLIFGVNELVSFCSQAFTLCPGDLIFTGTPPGVGIYRDPPVLLEEEDSVTVGIETIGELTNICRYR